MYRLLLTGILLAASAVQSGQVPSLDIDPDRITLSGISAGGQMAQQLHIAYSDLFSGAGIIAAGPFGCAEGSLVTALKRCLGKVDGDLPVTKFAARIRAAAAEGLVADTAALADDPVWLFHGTLDTAVIAEVNDALKALYAEFIPEGQIRYVNDFEAAHTFPSQGQGQPCTESQPPFVGDCDYDAAGEILNYLYSDLKAPGTESVTELTTVTLPGATKAGLNDTAYLYVPAACVDGQSCFLHLVLHGCAQSASQIGTEFIEQSGYLPWAEANDIVLAFPQVTPAANNPHACWDWWGYTGPDYRWRNGAQMKVLADWVGDLARSGD